MSANRSELFALGWHPFFEEHFRPHEAAGLEPARVAVQHRGAYLLYSAGGELSAELAGRLQGDYVRRDPGKLGFEARVSGRLPATGDWVAASVRLDEGRATIRAVLPRRTEFARKAPWLTTEEQVLAANMDTVFVVSALAAEIAVDDAANVRRLERFLALAHESGAQPVVLLTKADLRDDARQRALGLTRLGVHVVVSSSFTGEGLDELEPYLAPGKTAALLGSSGVGKSTLINTLLGTERLATRETRRDGVGRHTTMRRELIRLDGGGLIIDTPGLRELQLWDAEDGLAGAFADVDGLSAHCRFRDCRHSVEPGCAVLGAVERGELDASRLASFRRLLRELEHLEAKQDARATAQLKHRNRALARHARRLR